ncbi:hypothetical protein N0V86_007268 [Didymella sp. IMI 355093]|nr:hypothetical protein N0V86_007268 [Didymella sp. IMI 355093]
MIAGLFHYSIKKVPKKRMQALAMPLEVHLQTATSKKGGNTKEVAYQEASDAPVESDSPLGHSFGAVSIFLLKLSRIIDTGIYSAHPFKTTQKTGFIALLPVTVLYILADVAYFAAVPQIDLENSEQIAAPLFFENVFGSNVAVNGLNFLIALSAFGNLLAILIGKSRRIRECRRQGVLFHPNFRPSARPFGTPLGPYSIMWILTIVIILAFLAGDTFSQNLRSASLPRCHLQPDSRVWSDPDTDPT